MYSLFSILLSTKRESYVQRKWNMCLKWTEILIFLATIIYSGYEKYLHAIVFIIAFT